MLVRFSVENWQSYREATTLSLIASRQFRHRERVPRIKKYRKGILPAAAIYGGNASGKTKLFNALWFAKDFIVNVNQPEAKIQREHFKLDSQCVDKPSKFNFVILVEDTCYEFSFAVTHQKVLEEKLVKILTTREEVLYERKGKKISFRIPKLKNDKHLKFVANSTRSNQLFITTSIDQNKEHFKPIYDWFKKTLVLISPHSYFKYFTNLVDADDDPLLDDDRLLYPEISDRLIKLDTGISRLDSEKIPFENLPKRLQEAIISNCSSSERSIIAGKGDKLVGKKLVFFHHSEDGEVKFSSKDESAGTLRVINILPAFIDLVAPVESKVYFIDELDRCLHTLLTRKLLEDYLASCSQQTRSQLLFTTHDVLLMDQEILRRDEIWITERNQDGCSSLISFSDYKNVRYDKDIRKSYLQGRFGGIPKILL